jgi:hypothetical protein
VSQTVVSVPGISGSFGISIGFGFGYSGSFGFGFRCGRPLASVVSVSVRVTVVSTIVSTVSVSTTIISIPSISGSIRAGSSSCFGLRLSHDSGDSESYE